MFLDVKTAEGREVLDKLIEQADVFHSSFAPETYDRIGYGEDPLRELNPNIIFSMTNLYSLGGRRGYCRGHEELAEAVSGIAMRNSGTHLAETLDITVCDNSAGDEAAIFMTDTAEAWVKKLAKAGVTARVSRDFKKETMEEAYAKSRGLSLRRWHPGLGERRVVGTAPKLSVMPAIPGYAVPAYGTDGEAILETLGLDRPEYLAVTLKDATVR